MHLSWRSTIDLLASVAMGTAAVVLVWRMVLPPVAPIVRQQRPAVEDISKDALTTTLAGTWRRGPSDARVVLLEFSDYECPFCERHERDTAPEIHRAYVEDGRIQHAVRHFPLDDRHPHAQSAAAAAECAGAQGKFWDMHHRLFRRQKELANRVWLEESGALALDRNAFDVCFTAAADEVRRHVAEGQRLGVVSTPTFLIGYLRPDETVAIVRRIIGAHPVQVFRQALDDVIAALSAAPQL